MWNILYIEDDTIDQMAFRRIMSKVDDMTYTITNYVKEASKLIHDNLYELIITDYHLSDGTAHDVISIAGNVPVLVVTGTLRPHERESFELAGAVAYISKPLHKKDFLEIIYMILEKVDTQTYQFDLTYLKELSQGEPEFEQEMINLFIQEVPENLNSLKNALNKEDYKEAEYWIHKLKSKLRLMGMHQMRIWADYIEHNFKHKNKLDRTLSMVSILISGLNIGLEQARQLLTTQYEVSNHR